MTSLKFPTAETAKCPFNRQTNFKKESSASDYPHQHESGVYERCTGPISKIYDTILDHIGMTPMVRLNRIPQQEGIQCEVVAKCEFFNAGGSVKDRIGKRMIADAEKIGRIKLGDTLIEPTSGNTGIGLALTAAVKGYKMIITLPEKMSNEKVCTLQALGATIYRTPTEAAFDSPESHIGLANRLQSEIENSHILDQYCNPSNPLAHFDNTAEEILKQCDNKIDMIVMSAGTGGTCTGIAAKIKMKLPKCIVVGVDPHGSILAQPRQLNSEGIHSYHVEGIGYDFVPQVLQRRWVDHWVKTHDKESFVCCRRIIREEGLLCGGSSGSCLVGAMKAIKHFDLKKNQRCVVLFPDSIRNYMSKFLSDDWMIENKFYAKPHVAVSARASDFKNDQESNVGNGHKPGRNGILEHDTVANLTVSSTIAISSSLSCKEVIGILNSKKIDQLPIIKNNSVVGVISVDMLTDGLLNNNIKLLDNIMKVATKKFAQVGLTTSLDELKRIFKSNEYVLVMGKQQYYENNKTNIKSIVIGIITKIDLLNYLVEKNNNTEVLIEVD